MRPIGAIGTGAIGDDPNREKVLAVLLVAGATARGIYGRPCAGLYPDGAATRPDRLLHLFAGIDTFGVIGAAAV